MKADTRRGARYGRISEDVLGDEHGVKNQLEAEAEFAQRAGIQISDEHTYSDNDISATYGKHRPGYTALMEAAARREFHVILVFHTSRLWRNRKERAEGIEILKNAGISVLAVKGPSLDMSTAYGRGLAGLLGEFDTMESEIKSERQQLAHRARARAGVPPKGPRLTGYTADGMKIVEAEAVTVRLLFSRFYAGDSLRGLASHLNDTGVPSRKGKPWDPSSVYDILTNPRYCARSVYNRHGGGTEWVRGTWPPIVEEWLFDAVNTRLADPRRKLNKHGTDRKHLGAGLYLCPNGHPVRSHGTPVRYRCSEGCVTRTAAGIDKAVTALIRKRLALPDVARLVNKPEGEAATAAAEELRRQGGRLTQVEADYDADLIDGRRYKEKRAKIEAEIAAAEARLARLTAGSEVAGVITAREPVRAFDDAPLGVKQAVIRFFCDVTLLPAPRGKKGFDPASIRIEPRHPVEPDGPTSAL